MIKTVSPYIDKCAVPSHKYNFYHIDLLCPSSALEKQNADRVFYMATDLYAIDNPHYHDAEHYPYEDVYGQNKLRTPMFNNFSLKVSFGKIKCT